MTVKKLTAPLTMAATLLLDAAGIHDHPETGQSALAQASSDTPWT
jgi:hypothetical protein